MRKLLTLAACLTCLQVMAQDSTKWDLRRCVEYAVKNNISVKQADVQARVSALQFKQTQLYKYPSASFSTNLGPQFGRSIDPTTNSYTNTELFSQSYSLNGGIALYSWGKLRSGLDAYKFNVDAAMADVEKAANDVSLSVATYYLQVLAAKEQMNISEVQIAQTKTQLDITRKRVEAGALPELNLLEFEARLATDSSNLIANKTTYDQDVLFLKGLLNLDAAQPFEVDIPNVEKIPIETFAELEPEALYKLALTTQPLQKGNDFRIKSAAANIKSTKAALYPTLSANYSLGSTYNNKAYDVSYTPTTYASGTVKVNNVDYTVFSPTFIGTTSKQPYFSQLNQNFRQSLGLSLSVPIFSNGSNRATYEQSKLTLKNNLLSKEQADQKLKQDIYTAYTNAVNALQRLNASKRSVENAQKVYEASVKRYDVGLLGTLDLITNQNNLSTAKLQFVANQYDYVFRMKLLEFYKGQGLKL